MVPSQRQAIAAWVTERRGLAVLQATGGWLEEPKRATPDGLPIQMEPEARKP